MTLFTDNTLSVAREGQIAYANDNGQDIQSYFAEGTIRAGLLVERGTAFNQVKAVAALPAADPNGITATALVSAAAATHYGPALYDGVTGPNRIHPAQRLMFTLNAHANWLASAMSVMYEDPSGAVVVEDLLIPAGGNTILYTHAPASLLIDVWIPAQGGINGTCLVGVDPTYYGADPRGYPGIAVYDRMQEPSATTTVTFDDEEKLSVLRRGYARVITEALVTAGMPGYVRMVTVGADVRGQWRGSPATNFCRYPGAVFETDTAADGVAILRIGG